MRTAVTALLLAASLLAGCTTVTNPVTGQAERTVMDERTELAQGKEAHQQVLTEYGGGEPRQGQPVKVIQ